jgi:hypothetical protein
MLGALASSFLIAAIFIAKSARPISTRGRGIIGHPYCKPALIPRNPSTGGCRQ